MSNRAPIKRSTKSESGANSKTTELSGSSVPSVKPDIAIKPSRKDPRTEAPSEKPSHEDQKRLDEELFEAAVTGNLQEVVNLMAQGANPQMKDAHRRTPLHMAVSEGHLEVVKYLESDPRVDINAEDSDGWTPLYVAVDRGQLEIMKYFESNTSARLNTKDKKGRTPLHWAVSSGPLSHPKLEVVRYLASDTSVDLNAKDKHGFTPLMVAFRDLNSVEIMGILVEHGADPHCRGARGETALMTWGGYSTRWYDPDTPSIDSVSLLNAIAPTQIHGVDHAGNSALHYASSACHDGASGLLEYVYTLVNRFGVSPSIRNIHGQTAAELARANRRFYLADFMESLHDERYYGGSEAQVIEQKCSKVYYRELLDRHNKWTTFWLKVKTGMTLIDGEEFSWI